jgi:SAM-dependent methyltransferase
MTAGAKVPRFVSPDNPNFIDVNELKVNLSPDELLTSANEYFTQLTDVNPLITKPFSSGPSTSDLLAGFSASINALEHFNKAKILDFGTGTGWTARYLAQMGCDVFGVDISEGAIGIAWKMLDKLPLYGVAGKLNFNTYNGKNLNFEDAYFDRIHCFDAFHHVVNQQEIFNEFYRILKPGGRIVLSEPGPNQSKTVASQLEMRNFKVIEDDVIIEDLEVLAHNSGFNNFNVGIYNPIPKFFSVGEFNYLLNKNPAELIKPTLDFMENVRLIRIIKDGYEKLDSLRSESLKCLIEGKMVESNILVKITNNSDCTWLKSGIEVGSVNLVMHLLDEEKNAIEFDFQRFKLRENEILPGDFVELVLPLPKIESEVKFIEFDLVSEHIAWFKFIGNASLILSI